MTMCRQAWFFGPFVYDLHQHGAVLERSALDY
jgi:hypothetical protein